MTANTLSEFLAQVERLVFEYGEENILHCDDRKSLTIGFLAEKPLPDGKVQQELVEIRVSTITAAFSGNQFVAAPTDVPNAVHFQREGPPKEVAAHAFGAMVAEARNRGIARRLAAQETL